MSATASFTDAMPAACSAVALEISATICVHLAHARLDPRRRVLDQALDFAGGLRAALRQRTHFARDHGKTLALFARTRRFHSRVQRQDVGLERNAVDHADDLVDALGAVRNLTHGVDGVLCFFAALARQLRRFPGQRTDLAHMLGALRGRRG
ncbi:hypothetical protein G6F65_022068 [Rhizopus arrhizus]|nr:hypothetical protein G6F65_022068 [Rhizopus arrhizus]